MSDKRWKAVERAVAKDIGGRRIPVTGIDRDGTDVDAGLFAIQVKHRKTIPKWLPRWLEGICQTAAARSQIGVLLLVPPHRPRREAIVCLTWEAWVDLHGTPPGPPE
jgi:hypothetical protein